MISEAQKRATDKWQKKRIKRYCLAFHVMNDKDVIDWLDQQNNKVGYVKALIRSDIALQKAQNKDFK